MHKAILFIICLLFTHVYAGHAVTDRKPTVHHTLTHRPDVIYQGSPVEVVYDGQVVYYIGVDLRAATGTRAVKWNMATDTFEILERVKPVETFHIPEKMGGDTASSSATLVRTLQNDNAKLAHIQTDKRKLWTRAFRLPLASSTVTDTYGYDRATTGQVISHKGTDYRAAVGTSVYAMNSGFVRIAHRYSDYGGTVVIDHGQGVQTFYMHMSKLKVKPGQKVKSGQLIGLSGNTGYALGPHLHLTVRVHDVSVDPQLFMDLKSIK